MDLASKLDTRIRIERKTIIRDPQYGTEEVSWAEFGCVWAEVKDILPSRAERMAEQIQIARRPARIRIRYLAGITPDMRVISRAASTKSLPAPRCSDGAKPSS